jgi:hypothetical protein
MAVTSVLSVYESCYNAIREGILIQRANRQDKEFHWQNWVSGCLKRTGHFFEVGGRNSYPDFRMVKFTEGYEIKGLAYPGREASYDSNSQVPTGLHNGRTIFYVFGRYPSEPDGDSYPVLDLVVCHGDFLNANHEYTHKNRSIRGFGSYGDIMIRDRKMYVAPTPFGLVNGVAHKQTLILPDHFAVSEHYIQVGHLVRVETPDLIVAYTFDLQANTLAPTKIPNPFAGQEHHFIAWRLRSGPAQPVTMRQALDEMNSDDEAV